jgi:hypothetical protein
MRGQIGEQHGTGLRHVPNLAGDAALIAGAEKNACHNCRVSYGSYQLSWTARVVRLRRKLVLALRAAVRNVLIDKCMMPGKERWIFDSNYLENDKTEKIKITNLNSKLNSI